MYVCVYVDYKGVLFMFTIMITSLVWTKPDQSYIPYLVTRSTAGFEHLSIVSAAVDASIFEEVNQIH